MVETFGANLESLFNAADSTSIALSEKGRLRRHHASGGIAERF